MGLFSRKRRGQAEPSIDPSHWIGRKFRSSCSVEESLRNFESIKADCYPVTGDLIDVAWTAPTDLSRFTSSQGNNVTTPPVRVVANKLTNGSAIYLALWQGMVSYGDGAGVGGPPCEMWFVPPGFDTDTPIRIAGTWKMCDGSLPSIGWVESPLWGVQG